MNRILFEPGEIQGGRAVFDGVRAEHVINVLHGEVGQVLRTGVVDGLAGESVVEAIEPLPPDPATGLLQGRITVRCEHRDEPPAPWADLLLAPPRPRAMKRLLPQIAQMGVGRIVLVGAQKTEKAFWGAQLLKEEIYRPLLIDGLQQAGTTAVPTVETFKSFRHFAERKLDAHFEGQPARIVAHPEKAPLGEATLPSLPEMARDRQKRQECRFSEAPVLAVGPEGGWTDAEVALLEEKGFARMSLGPRILRTDTALIVLIGRLMEIYDRPPA